MSNSYNGDVASEVSGGKRVALSRSKSSEFSRGLRMALPQGVIQTQRPYVPHDYTLVSPMNIKASDELLLKLALAKRHEMGDKGTLYLVIGECHPMPSHIMSEAGLLENLAIAHQIENRKAYRPVFCLEKEFNGLATVAEVSHGLNVPKSKKYSLQQHDPLSHIFLRSTLAVNYYDFAVVSMNCLSNTVLRYAMPVVLFDCAFKSDGFHIDGSDVLASTIAKDKFKISLTSQDIPSYISGSVGMDIRNAVMAHRIFEGAKNHSAGIVIVATGAAHLGDKTDRLPFQTSLPYVLAEKIDPDDRILSLFMVEQKGIWTPERVMPEGSHPKITPLVLRGLAEKEFEAESDLSREAEFIIQLGKSYQGKRQNWLSSAFGRPIGIPERFFPKFDESSEQVKAAIESILVAP